MTIIDQLLQSLSTDFWYMVVLLLLLLHYHGLIFLILSGIIVPVEDKMHGGFTVCGPTTLKCRQCPRIINCCWCHV